jgi:hypothetical protein
MTSSRPATGADFSRADGAKMIRVNNQLVLHFSPLRAGLAFIPATGTVDIHPTHPAVARSLQRAESPSHRLSALLPLAPGERRVESRRGVPFRGWRAARSRSFRQSFLVGFATRIGRRLEESVNTVISDVLKEQGNDLLPVLAERSPVVDDHRNQAFPEFDEHHLSVKDWSGWVVGTAAADAADIARGPLLDKRATA